MTNVNYQELGKSLCNHIDNLSDDELLAELTECGLSFKCDSLDVQNLYYTGSDSVVYDEISYVIQDSNIPLSFSVNNMWFKKGA